MIDSKEILGLAKKLSIILIVALLLVLVSGVLGGIIGYNAYKSRHAKDDGPSVQDTTWFTIVEQEIIYLPTDTVTVTEYKVVKVPLTDVGMEPGVDSAQVSLPFEQHFASLEDVADIWYSGYLAKIDSSIVYKHYTTQIINKPYEVKVFKQPILTLDIGMGNHQWKQLDPYVFARATVRAGNWKIEPYAGYTYSRQPLFGIGASYSFVLVK